MVSHDRIRQRTFEQFAEIPALRVVAELVFKVFFQDRVQQHCREQKEVPKISSKDQILQRTSQILDVPVPPMMDQLREVPKMVSQDSIQRRTAEQIVDRPVFKDFSLWTGFNIVALSRTSKSLCRSCWSSWRKCPTCGLPSRSSTCQFPRWWRNFPRGTGFNSRSRSRVSARSASRSVELNRLSMCQPGKLRCPSVWETRASHSSFGEAFSGCTPACSLLP